MKKPHIHGFNPSPEHPDYEECESCQSLHRIRDVAPASIYESGYWDRPGFSSLDEQVYNVSGFKSEHGLTKAEAVLQHAGRGSHALELACAPGSLLKALRGHYDHVVGVEVDARYRDSMLKIIEGQAALVFGSFPDVSKHWPGESFDFICAMDLLEHVDDGEAFMAEVLRLLKPDGTVVFMSPFRSVNKPVDPGQLVPEHVWIYSTSFIKEWFGRMFKQVILDQWIPNHDIIVGKIKR